MVLTDLAGVLLRPRRQFRDIARTGRRPLTAGIVVVATGTALAALDATAGALEPAASRAGSGAASIAISAAVLPLLVAFWLVCAWLVDAAAALMSAGRRFRAYLLASAYAVPILTVYGLVRLVQALLDRGGAADAVSTGVGLLVLVLLVWFVALLASAARAVYDLPPLNAVAAAMLPFAAVTTVLMVLLLVASVLHAAGVL